MSAKKQFADMENTIMLLEDKIEKLEDDHATLKQMIAMQNSLIDNLQMMVKMMSQQSFTMSVKAPIHGFPVDTFVGGGEQQDKEIEEVKVEESQQQSSFKKGGLKHRMSRVA